MSQLYTVIVAAGEGKRMGGPLPKQFLALRGRPILDWSLSTFDSMEEVGGMVLVAPEEHHQDLEKRFREQGGFAKLLKIVAGGQSRQESVLAGLRALPPEAEYVAIHDAVRPYVTPQLILATYTLAQQIGAAIPVVAIHDTLIQVDEHSLLRRPISRDQIRRSQTPQIFRADIIADAHEKARKEGLEFTDDATLAAFFGYPVATFVHFGENRKITTPQDLEKITMQKLGKHNGIRVGQGIDAHSFGGDGPLMLGGVRFNSEQGLQGHSDADVLCHAICDALFGAAAMGDIGHYFPDTDPAYKNASGKALLEETVQLVRSRGYEPVFIDASVICEHPKISLRREEMSEKIAEALSMDSDCISIKGTTTEGMGFTGRKEGIVATAIATVEMQQEEEGL